jgi:hypothetical protein
MAGAGALVAWLGLSLSDSRQAWPESRVDSAFFSLFSLFFLFVTFSVIVFSHKRSKLAPVQEGDTGRVVPCDNITALIIRSFWSSWWFTALYQRFEHGSFGL